MPRSLRYLLGLLPCLVMLMVSMAQAAGFEDLTFTDPKLGSIKYRVYTPESYDPKGEPIPVVMYLHSAAERGDDVDVIFGFKTPQQTWKNDWIDLLINETQKGNHKAILVMPVGGAWQVWNSMTAGDNWGVGDYTNAQQKPISPRLELAVKALENVIDKNHIDKNRVYVTGPSMGGFGTWDALARYPKLFAAGIPLSGGGNVEIFSKELATKPVWMFHGVEDGLIRAINTDKLYFAMKQGGGNPIYSRIMGEGHGGWNLFYKPGVYTVDSPSKAGGTGLGVYDWLFAQRLDQPSAATKSAASLAAPILIGFGPSFSTNEMVEPSPDGSSLMMYNFVESKDLKNLNDINGGPTKISITRTGGIGGGGPQQLKIASPLAQTLPEYIFKRHLFATEPGGFTLNFSGLTDSNTYTFEVYGNCDAGKNDDCTTEYVLNGKEKQAKTLQAANNAKDTVTFESVRSSSGKLTLHVGKGSDGKSKGAYLNSVRITVTAKE